MCIFIYQVRLLKKWRPLKKLTHFWHYAVHKSLKSFEPIYTQVSYLISFLFIYFLLLLTKLQSKALPVLQRRCCQRKQDSLKSMLTWANWLAARYTRKRHDEQLFFGMITIHFQILYKGMSANIKKNSQTWFVVLKFSQITRKVCISLW